MVTRLGSMPIFVTDQDRALEFYRDKLGFEVVYDVPIGGDRRWIAVAREKGETELILFHPESYSGNAERSEELHKRVGIWTGIIFLTDDIQADYKMLCESGVEFDSEPQKQPWGGWEAFFRDPDGNRFHLAQRPAGM